ncbi:unnamed protein product [Echinostoma caproni]|uniref:LIM zinc-binding domain-containing protein n=1 Tax=Echinostoma caproni TaxID=27848 RepID=A0A183A866_9TREM|nr:unnamed protein product [Echinostoma caproni]
MQVLDQHWHTACLKCMDCGIYLSDKCFIRTDEVYCKTDFFRRFGTKCAGCEKGIPPSEVVRTAQSNVYHMDCFVCVVCDRMLNTGDEFYLLRDRKLMCKFDFEAAKARAIRFYPLQARHSNESRGWSKRGFRFVLNIYVFTWYSAKEKRLKKDAGRHLWAISNSVLLDASMDTLGAFRSGTARELGEHEPSSKRLSETYSFADDSISGDGYTSRDDLQQDGLSDNDSLYSEDPDNSGESELITGADHLMPDKYSQPLTPNDASLEANPSAIEQTTNSCHTSADLGPRWATHTLKPICGTRTPGTSDLDPRGTELPLPAFLSQMHGITQSSDSIKPYGVGWDSAQCKPSVLLPNTGPDFSFGQTYQLPRVSSRNLISLPYTDGLNGTTPSVSETPLTSTNTGLPVKPFSLAPVYPTAPFWSSVI